MISKQNKRILAIAAVAAFALIVLPGFTGSGSVIDSAADLIASIELFEPHPYPDYKQYSWGYGTQAPEATGTISEAEARAALYARVQSDYDYLSGIVTRNLNTNQWAALLSFTFNEGHGGADNIIDDVNAGDDSELEAHWKEYIYAGGVINSGLIDRRNKEWQVWIS